jgi:hypothetical protein
LPALRRPIPFSGRQHSSLGATEFLHSDPRTKGMMLKIVIPTETGNQAIKNGSLHKIFEATMS